MRRTVQTPAELKAAHRDYADLINRIATCETQEALFALRDEISTMKGQDGWHEMALRNLQSLANCKLDYATVVAAALLK